MSNYKTVKIIPIALVIIIIAVAIAALVSVSRAIFFSGNNKTNSLVDISKDTLLNVAVGNSVRMKVRGNLVANEAFRSYQIDITPNSRTIIVNKGYENTQINKIELGNTTVAYEQFVYALDRANLIKGVELDGPKNDLRGICATGIVYEFQVLKANKPVKSLWASSCPGSKGSLLASVAQLSGLFTKQIPGSDKLIHEVR
jgi:hypothetical protein